MAEEKKFETKIKCYLTEIDVFHLKFFANAFTPRGIPDLLCCIRGRFLGIEVKAENGRASELQIYNIKRIISSGGYALIVKPSQFDKLKKFCETLDKEIMFEILAENGIQI